jgi:putative ABC transport system permease protein
MTTSTMIAERILTLVVRETDQREAIIGDLREELSRYSARVGVVRASRWHTRQCVGIAVRYGFTRLLRRKPPVRWISVATMEADSPGWSGMGRDLRYAWRAIVQRPALSAVVVFTLAMALAANSTTFSLLDALVLRPYRFAGIERLIVATTAAPDDSFVDRINVTGADFREWQLESKTVQQWAMYSWWDANLSGVDVPEQVAGFSVSPGYFSLLNVTPVLGREFLQSEVTPGQHRRVVLGQALWTRRFAANPQIVGTTVRLDGEPYEVVGVAPPGFSTPDGADIWRPLAMDDAAWANRRAANYGILGKLAEGQTVDGARAEIAAIADRQRADHPDSNGRRHARVLTFTAGMADPGAGPFMAISQTAAMLLLFVACANIANLLMARGAERSSEYALRLALGARRSRLFAQTLLEGLLLAAMAIVLAMPLITMGLGISRASIPSSVRRFIPGWSFIQVDFTLFAVTASLGTLAMIVFSLLPAFQAVRAQVSDTLRQSGRSLTPGRNRQLLRSALATTQIALALALLFVSTLALSAADRAVNGLLGFDKNNVLVAQLNLPERNYPDQEKRRQLFRRITDAMKTIPAVSEVGVVNMIPAGFNNTNRRIYPEGQTLKEAEARWTEFRRITPEYLQALRIPVQRGRTFNAGDHSNSMPVAMVSSAMARHYWGDEDPIGKRFRASLGAEPTGAWLTVVGVVGNVVHNWFVRETQAFYVPVSQDAPLSFAVAVRTIGDPSALAGDLRRAINAVDADQPVASLDTLATLVDERAAGFAFIARALGVVGAIALVLSVMGIYSLMAFLTAQRTQEIGVRMALGAGRWEVVRAVTKRAVGITLAGTVIGGLLAFALGTLMQSVLFGMVSNNFVQLAVIVLAIGLAALMAAYLPARRASRIDPMTALRQP